MAFTVAELIAELQKLPQDLAVFTQESYDNDCEWVRTSSVRVATVYHAEDIFYMEIDPADLAAEPEWYEDPQQAVLIS